MNAFTFVGDVLRCIIAFNQFLELPKNRIEIDRMEEGAAYLGSLGKDGTGDIVRSDSRKG